MKTDWSLLESFRNRLGHYASRTGDHFGMFKIEHDGVMLLCIAADGDETEWEHVSVSAWSCITLKPRIPTWEEMAFIKDRFWDEDECVVQFHPPKSEYVNFTDHVLHLWKPTGMNIPTPPTILIAPTLTPT